MYTLSPAIRGSSLRFSSFQNNHFTCQLIRHFSLFLLFILSIFQSHLGAIIFGSDQEVREVMRAVRRNKATGMFSWIGSDGWSARNLVSDGNEAEVCDKCIHHFASLLTALFIPPTIDDGQASASVPSSSAGELCARLDYHYRLYNHLECVRGHKRLLALSFHFLILAHCRPTPNPSLLFRYLFI